MDADAGLDCLVGRERDDDDNDENNSNEEEEEEADVSTDRWIGPKGRPLAARWEGCMSAGGGASGRCCRMVVVVRARPAAHGTGLVVGRRSKMCFSSSSRDGGSGRAEAEVVEIVVVEVVS